MANSSYSKDSLATYLLWEKQIDAGQRLRKQYPPVMLTHRGGICCKGYYDHCDVCGTKVSAEFGDYSQPLAEHFVPCPVSNDPGHGVWASVINIIEN